MPLFQSRPDLVDQLWKGIKPLLQTRAATVALTMVRRNPKTAIALGVASAAGALLAAIARKRAASREAESTRLLPQARNRSLPGYVSNPVSTNGSPAMTQ